MAGDQKDNRAGFTTRELAVDGARHLGALTVATVATYGGITAGSAFELSVESVAGWGSALGALTLARSSGTCS